MSETNKETQNLTDPDPFKIKFGQTKLWDFIDLQKRSWIMFFNAEGTKMRCIVNAKVWDHGIQGIDLETFQPVRLTTAEKIADWQIDIHFLLMRESADHQSLVPMRVPALLTIECHPLLSVQIDAEKQRQMDVIANMQDVPDKIDLKALTDQIISPDLDQITAKCAAMKPVAEIIKYSGNWHSRGTQEQLYILQAILYPQFALAESVNALYDGQRKQFHEHFQLKIGNRCYDQDVFMDDGASCSVMDPQKVEELHIPYLPTQKHVKTMYGGRDLRMVEVNFLIPERIAGNLPESARLLPLKMVVYNLSETGPRQILIGTDFIETGTKLKIFSFQEPRFLPYQDDSPEASDKPELD